MVLSEARVEEHHALLALSASSHVGPERRNVLPCARGPLPVEQLQHCMWCPVPLEVAGSLGLRAERDEHAALV